MFETHAIYRKMDDVFRGEKECSEAESVAVSLPFFMDREVCDLCEEKLDCYVVIENCGDVYDHVAGKSYRCDSRLYKDICVCRGCFDIIPKKYVSPVKFFICACCGSTTTTNRNGSYLHEHKGNGTGTGTFYLIVYPDGYKERVYRVQGDLGFSQVFKEEIQDVCGECTESLMKTGLSKLILQNSRIH